MREKKKMNPFLYGFSRPIAATRAVCVRAQAHVCFLSNDFHLYHYICRSCPVFAHGEQNETVILEFEMALYGTPKHFWAFLTLPNRSEARG